MAETPDSHQNTSLPRAEFWESFQREVPQWYLDAKLGIFVSWGPFSVPAYGEPIGELGTVDSEIWFRDNPYAEWYFNTIRIKESGARAYHDKTYGGADYDDFLDQWSIDNFNPDSWLELFARAGAKYVVPLSKHHDGVTLWDAPGTGTRNTVHRGPRTDIMGEIAAAARRHGVRFSVYYSGGLDWGLHNQPPIQGFTDVFNFRPNDAAYSLYAYRHVMDLVERYEPGILWNDIEWPDFAKLGDQSVDFSLAKLFHEYYQAVPDGLVNDRWGNTHWDYKTSEYQAFTGNESGQAWENCRGIGMSFGYNKFETEEHSFSPESALRYFIDIVHRGGNLLLNVGPDASGAIPDVQLRVLEGMADWMGRHSESIHGSRAVPDGVAVGEAGDDVWVRFTGTTDRVFAHIDSTSSEVHIPARPQGIDIEQASMLDGSGEVSVEERDGGMHVSMPARSGLGPQVVAFMRR